MTNIIHTYDRLVRDNKSAGSTSSVSWEGTLTGHIWQQVEFDLGGTTEGNYAIHIPITNLKAIMAWALFNGGAPYSSLTIEAQWYKAGPTQDLEIDFSSYEPFVWIDDDTVDCPFSGDIISIHLDGPGGGSQRDGIVYIRTLTAAVLGT